jgi:hypothetical protein
MAVLGYVFAWLLTSDLRDEQAIWDHGVPATHAAYEGTEVHSRTSTSYSFAVSYVDQSGRQHSGRVSFETFTSFHAQSDPEVRYDPANPDVFALNVAVFDAAWHRWEYGYAYGGLVPFMAAACLVIITMRVHRTMRLARRCALDGKPVVLDLVFPKPFVRRGGTLRYDFRLTRPDGSVHRAFVDFEKGHGPLFVAGSVGTMRILGLESTSHRDAVLALREDLHPLDVSADEARRIAAEACAATADAV